MRIKLGIPYTVSPTITVSHLCTDSREVQRGDLYISVRGNEKYKNDALKKGAYLPDTNLLELASQYKKTLKKLEYTVGITGSVGKTTTKEFLNVILSSKYNTHATHGNFNNDIGMPITILQAEENVQALILEIGMNHSGEISLLSKCANPNIAIITNIGSAHIGNLGSRENIAKAKLEIIDGMESGVIIVPYEEPLLSKQKNLMTFSCENKTADIYIENVSERQVKVYRNGEFITDADFSIQGKHFLSCLGAAVGAACISKLRPDELKSGIEKISEENTRQKIIEVDDYFIFADYYNSSFDSVIADFKLVSSLNYEKKSVLIGSIYELGSFSEQIHFDVGVNFAHYDFSKLYIIGEYSDYVLKGAVSAGFPAENIFVNTDTAAPETTANQIIKNHSPGEIILFKASRAVKLERVLEIIDKVH